MNFTYFVTLSLLVVLIVNNGQCASILSAQPVGEKADSSIVLNYRYVEDWEDFVLLNVNATETGPKQIESCSLSLQSQHDVKGKLYWSSAFDYAVIHSSRLESENKIVFSVLVKDVKPSPNYRITAVCKHSDGMLTLADNLDFKIHSTMSKARIMFAQPIHVEDSSSIVLNYKFDSILEDYIALTLNATETRSKIVKSCSLSVEKSADGKKHWTPTIDYSITDYSRPEFENKFIFNIQLKHLKPSPVYRFTVFCIHYDLSMTSSDNLDIDVDSIEY
ncbi:uncharacterized protein LOC128389376 [Panonychus citri]|uniref:uncharacterized protein LOC128389376 n=1 Tax=Panonychus citri TaxID=50023 RepID=UPI002307D988|nr:uncharacterized protein LOC128389376 [Panonychus citri]